MLGASGLRRFIAVECLNTVLIDRSGRSSTDPLQAPVELLERGHSLILFPEGTRSGDGAMGRFRSGLYNLARRFPQTEPVPVYLDNPRRVMPYGKFPHFQGKYGRPFYRRVGTPHWVLPGSSSTFEIVVRSRGNLFSRPTSLECLWWHTHKLA